MHCHYPLPFNPNMLDSRTFFAQHYIALSCFAPVLQKSVQGSPESASGYAKLAFQLSAGGPAVGMAFALCLSAWLKLAGGNLFADLGMTLVAAYGSFHVADILGCSNILATVTLGMSMALFGWSMLHKDVQDPVTVCW